MARHNRGVMLRGMMQSKRGRGGKAGGKAGKRGLGDAAREQLVSAHALVEAGNHAEAADAFGTLSAIASERGRPQIAAWLALRGATSKLESGDVSGSVEAARVGIDHAEGISEKKRVGRFFGRFVKNLRNEDADAAKELADETRRRFGLKTLPVPTDGVSPNRAQRRSLPKHCDGCGTKIDGSTILFEDDGTADCPTCGYVLL